MPTTPYPVVLQPDDDAPLNEKRRAVVVNNLTALGIFDAAARVVIHYPEAEGLFGDEAEPKYQHMISPRNYGGGYLGGATGGFLGGYGSFVGTSTFTGSFSGSFAGGYGSFSGGFYGFR